MIVHLVDGRVKGFASRGWRGRHTGMFYVYLLHSTKDNGFYIGYSTDLKRRLPEHTRGASFATKSRGPWKLVYYEAYTEREDAEGREKFLKSGAGRRLKLVVSHTPSLLPSLLPSQLYLLCRSSRSLHSCAANYVTISSGSPRELAARFQPRERSFYAAHRSAT